MTKEPKETQVTGMPPTPEKLTRLGAPVDERFVTPEAAQKPEQKTEPKEDDAKRRTPKSDEDNGDDNPKGQSKRRR